MHAFSTFNVIITDFTDITHVAFSTFNVIFVDFTDITHVCFQYI